ncbi:MAG: metallophosphoesterase family protein, partial [Candidatus Competibacteraceae bacterium]|nr:metallophosphoesterase family protein [Candidatus Competibacteraceae bacterium]
MKRHQLPILPRRRSWRALVWTMIFGLWGCGTVEPGPLEVADKARLAEAVARFPAGGDSAVLVGAGDIVRCEMPGPALATGNLVRAVLDAFPKARVFSLGDNAYDQGTEREYRQCYDAAWGSFNERTAPVPGNHDYRTPEAGPYFDYFDYFDDHPQARERGGYYSFDLENWHVVALNSHISMEEG